MDVNKIGNQIKKIRKEKGLSQAELAEKVGVSDKTISKWETGIALPNLMDVRLLCDALDIRIDNLLSQENNSKLIKKNNLFWLVVGVVCCFLFSILLLKTVNPKIEAYSVASENENFILNGIALNLPTKDVLFINDIIDKDNLLSNIEIVNYEVILKKDQQTLYQKQLIENTNPLFSSKSLASIVSHLTIYLEKEKLFFQNDESKFTLIVKYENQNEQISELTIDIALKEITDE